MRRILRQLDWHIVKSAALLIRLGFFGAYSEVSTKVLLLKNGALRMVL